MALRAGPSAIVAVRQHFGLVLTPGKAQYRGMAGTLLSSSRAKAVRSNGRHPIPVVQIEPPTPFVEGPGPGREWWEKALSEKRFCGPKRKKGQQNQGVGAKSRTTHLGPFGEVIRATGPMAKLNPFRFSTKYQDDETDLNYYGYRFYKASTGSWESRDPLGEPGFEAMRQQVQPEDFFAVGPNRYLFVQNDPLNKYDIDGLNPAACAVGIALAPIEIPAGAIIAGTVVVAGVTYFVWRLCRCKPKECLPCQPPVGTIAYRVSYDGRPHGGVPTPHSHQYEMQQSPPSAGCVCFWANLKVTLPGVLGPPIVPAGGGGIAP
jgi:RHS repeat-associated protein